MVFPDIPDRNVFGSDYSLQLVIVIPLYAYMEKPVLPCVACLAIMFCHCDWTHYSCNS